MKVLPGLRVLKHAFRGLSYARVGRYRRALQAFRRALQLDPNNRLARDGFWDVHRSLDLEQIANDPQTLALVDLDLCLQRAGSLLLQPGPSAGQLDESHRLLDLVLRLQPALRPAIDYWLRCRAHPRSPVRRAAEELEHDLDPSHYGPGNPQRHSVLLSAWQLALLLHDELRRRVGLAAAGAARPAHGGHRRRRAPPRRQPRRSNDLGPQAHALSGCDRGGVRRLRRPGHRRPALRSRVRAATRPGPDRRQHALAARRRISAHGRARSADARPNHLRADRPGPPAPATPTRLATITSWPSAPAWPSVRRTSPTPSGKRTSPPSSCSARTPWRAATSTPPSRTTTSMPSRNGAVWKRCAPSPRFTKRRAIALSALRVTDQALVYNPKDKDLLERKDRYYYSVMPEQMRARLESVRTGFRSRLLSAQGRVRSSMAVIPMWNGSTWPIT